MKNPYAKLPTHNFWKSSVASPRVDDIDPVVSSPFSIKKSDRVVTAGSCFAQHISRELKRSGFNFFVAEKPPANALDPASYDVFSARYGNIYTVRQLLQLFQRAYGLFRPKEPAWQRVDGAFVDPFRPQVETAGFPTLQALEQDRKQHLRCVRQVFERCDVFVFTLGLTEGWVSCTDGAVYPVAPGVVGSGPDPDDYQFHNFTVDSMLSDLSNFLDLLNEVNPEVQVILTVSPVPLIATYEDRHVLVSNTYSKSALRVVAEYACRDRSNVLYFPSYEIITGSYNRGAYFEPDLRSVTMEGVGHVMRVFARHLLSSDPIVDESCSTSPVLIPKFSNHDSAESSAIDPVIAARYAAISAVVCDEEVIEKSLTEVS